MKFFITFALTFIAFVTAAVALNNMYHLDNDSKGLLGVSGFFGSILFSALVQLHLSNRELKRLFGY